MAGLSGVTVGIGEGAGEIGGIWASLRGFTLFWAFGKIEGELFGKGNML